MSILWGSLLPQKHLINKFCYINPHQLLSENRHHSQLPLPTPPPPRHRVTVRVTARVTVRVTVRVTAPARPEPCDAGTCARQIKPNTKSNRNAIFNEAATRHRPTVGSYGDGVSSERGTPVPHLSAMRGEIGCTPPLEYPHPTPATPKLQSQHPKGLRSASSETPKPEHFPPHPKPEQLYT